MVDASTLTRQSPGQETGPEGSAVGAESVVRAGACVKQRDRFGDRSILDGFPAKLVGTLTDAPALPGRACPPGAVATLRRVER
jgi:carbonic anhydrase/acetyltransferase-like protein (isoleucine patch superfamily)